MVLSCWMIIDVDPRLEFLVGHSQCHRFKGARRLNFLSRLLLDIKWEMGSLLQFSPAHLRRPGFICWQRALLLFLLGQCWGWEPLGGICFV
jgi:hypothetical protein